MERISSYWEGFLLILGIKEIVCWWIRCEAGDGLEIYVKCDSLSSKAGFLCKCYFNFNASSTQGSFLMEKNLVGAAKIAARLENKVASDEKKGDVTQV